MKTCVLAANRVDADAFAHQVVAGLPHVGEHRLELVGPRLLLGLPVLRGEIKGPPSARKLRRHDVALPRVNEFEVCKLQRLALAKTHLRAVGFCVRGLRGETDQSEDAVEQ